MLPRIGRGDGRTASPFNCPVDRYIRSVGRHQLSRLLAALRDPEASIAYRRIQGLAWFIYTRRFLLHRTDFKTVQLLLQTALDRKINRSWPRPRQRPTPPRAGSSSPGPATLRWYASASLFFRAPIIGIAQRDKKLRTVITASDSMRHQCASGRLRLWKSHGFRGRSLWRRLRLCDYICTIS